MSYIISMLLPTADALIVLLSLLAIVSIIRTNKGAKTNLAWLLLALGFTLIGISLAIISLSVFSNGRIPIMTALIVAPAARFVGLLLVLFGLLYWRRLLKKLVK